MKWRIQKFRDHITGDQVLGIFSDRGRVAIVERLDDAVRLEGVPDLLEASKKMIEYLERLGGADPKTADLIAYSKAVVAKCEKGVVNVEQG